MARGRTHSPEFKLEVVRQIASGTKRPVQVCWEYGPANSVVDRWRHEYAARGEAAFTPSEVTGDAALEGRIAELDDCLRQRGRRITDGPAPTVSRGG